MPSISEASKNICAGFGYICGGLILILFIRLFTYVINLSDKKRDSISKLVLLYAFFGILCYGISCFSEGIDNHLNIIDSYQLNTNSIDNEYNSTDIIQALFWHFGNCFVYLLFLNRLYYGFNNSSHKIKKSSHIIIFIMVIAYLISSLLLIPLAMILKNNNDSIDIKSWNIINIIYRILTQIFDFIISFVILFLFISKLNKVSQSLYNIDLRSTQDLSDILNSQRDSIFNIMSKVFLLSAVMIISTQIVLVTTLLAGILYDWCKLDKSGQIMVEIFIFCRIFDCFITSLCIFLYFEYTQKYYIKCCHCLHTKIKQYFIKNIEKSLNDATKYISLTDHVSIQY